MPDDENKPFNNPFAALKGTLKDLPDQSRAPVAAPKGPARAVLRLEKKGRGGKEVTVVAQLELSLVQRETWLKELKRALGCGGSLEGDELVFQGDHRERLEALLTARGVRKVSVG